MSANADHLYFGQDMQVYLYTENNTWWKVPVEGVPQFEQNAQSEPVTVSTMPQIPSPSSAALSTSNSKHFKTEYDPASFSFSTAIRPYTTGTNKKQAAESVLWEHLVGGNTLASQSTAVEASLKDEYSKFDLYIVYKTGFGFKLTGCVLTTASISVGIDTLATIAWSGLALKLDKVQGFTAPAQGIWQNRLHLQNNVYLRNKLSIFNMKDTYNVAAVSASVEFKVQHTPVVPSILGEITYPVSFSRGPIEASGSVSAYFLGQDTTASNGPSAAHLGGVVLQEMLVPDNGPETDPIRLHIGGTTAGSSVTVLLPSPFIQNVTLNPSEAMVFEISFTSASPTTDTTELTLSKTSQFKVTYN